MHQMGNAMERKAHEHQRRQRDLQALRREKIQGGRRESAGLRAGSRARAKQEPGTEQTRGAADGPAEPRRDVHSLTGPLDALAEEAAERGLYVTKDEAAARRPSTPRQGGTSGGP